MRLRILRALINAAAPTLMVLGISYAILNNLEALGMTFTFAESPDE